MFVENEPYYGWLAYYNPENDENSPFFGVEPNIQEYDRFIYNYPAHPDWNDFGSENLLLKILFADYDQGFAVLELFGEWNDLHLNDFKMLAENVLTWLLDSGIRKFILICENVFNIYLDADDYYEALQEELEEGWVCIVRARQGVLDEISRYGMDRYLYRNALLDDLQWRKLKPWDLFRVVDDSISRLLNP